MSGSQLYGKKLSKINSNLKILFHCEAIVNEEENKMSSNDVFVREGLPIMANYEKDIRAIFMTT